MVTSNGVLNLVPDKPAAFGEIARVLKPGGRLQIADIALRVPVSDQSRADPRLWAECVVGAICGSFEPSMARSTPSTMRSPSSSVGPPARPSRQRT